MKDFEIIDNFLSEDIHKNISDMVFGGELPLFCQHNTLPDGEFGSEELNEKHNIKREGHPFFYHMFFKDLKHVSDWDSMYMPIMEKLNPLAMIRVKLNVFSNAGEPISSGWHLDMNETETAHTTAIYHLNTNNGYILFEDGTKVKSVANRLIIFPGNIIHTGITQTDKDLRAFINLNYIK
jgi:hypothetical protein